MQGLDPFPNVPLRAHQPSTTEMLLSTLGASLGQSIPKAFQQQYQAEQYKTLLPRLEAARNDPNALINLALTPGLSPEHSKAIIGLAENLQTQQQKQATKQQEQIANKRALDALAVQRGGKPGDYDAYIDNPQIAVTGLKPPKPTQASQPIDPEQLAKIQAVRNTPEYKEANPLQKFQLLTDAGVSRENAQSEADIAAQQDKLRLDALDKGTKANEDYVNGLYDQNRASEEMDFKLDRYLNLEDLPNPALAALFESFGWPPAIFSADAEEAQKITTDLTKNIQQFYGNRILQTEFQTFLKSIPDLKNSVEGRRRIIANLKKFNELRKIEYKKMNELADQYEKDGKPLPSRFRHKVWDALKPEVDAIAKNFNRPNPPPNTPPNFIPVSNGQETLWIDPSDLEAAKADKYEAI